VIHNALHIRYQLLHVSAPRCHPQAVYLQQRIVTSNTLFRCRSP